MASGELYIEAKGRICLLLAQTLTLYRSLVQERAKRGRKDDTGPPLLLFRFMSIAILRASLCIEVSRRRILMSLFPVSFRKFRMAEVLRYDTAQVLPVTFSVVPASPFA